MKIPSRQGVWAAVLVVLTAVLVAALPGASSGASARRCRDVVVRNPDGSVYLRTNGLFAVRVGCRKARRVARRWISGAEGNTQVPRPLGFECRSAGRGFVCSKGRQRVRWRYPRASSATAGTPRSGIVRARATYSTKRERFGVYVDRGHVRCRVAKRVLKRVGVRAARKPGCPRRTEF
jgi:hypothetical protein